MKIDIQIDLHEAINLPGKTDTIGTISFAMFIGICTKD